MEKKQKLTSITLAVIGAVIAAVLLLLFILAPKQNENIPQTQGHTEVGDYITFGAYEQDGNSDNGKEPVKWLVLEEKDGKYLVISSYALDCRSYHTANEAVTWETCSLRKWLNEDFVQAAFSQEEKGRISIFTVPAEGSSANDTDAGNATQDRVFLLSVPEVEKYLSSNEDRQCAPTEYAVANGANRLDGYCWWWLRSQGSDQNTAASIRNNGAIYDGGIDVTSLDPIRPAMWIDIDN